MSSLVNTSTDLKPLNKTDNSEIASRQNKKDEGKPVDPLLRLEEISVVRAKKNILKNVNWEILPGQQWVILGSNGAGKTTLARLLAGRDFSDSGQLSIFGLPVGDHSGIDLAARVGFSSAEIADRVPFNESAISVVMTAAWGQSISFDEEYENSDKERAINLLAALGIAELGDQSFASLSEGERRRVLLARSLMADPELLIMDEPTAGLDLGGREILLQALSEIIKSPSAPNVILITHELEEIGADFTHALLLHEGTVLAQGPIDQVITDTNLSEAFGISLSVKRVDGRWWATATR